MKNIIILFVCLFSVGNVFASYILIPMDAEGQKNHLKAYELRSGPLTNSRK